MDEVELVDDEEALPLADGIGGVVFPAVELAARGDFRPPETDTEGSLSRIPLATGPESEDTTAGVWPRGVACPSCVPGV